MTLHPSSYAVQRQQLMRNSRSKNIPNLILGCCSESLAQIDQDTKEEEEKEPVKKVRQPMLFFFFSI
jgi:hypothetical protein